MIRMWRMCWEKLGERRRENFTRRRGRRGASRLTVVGFMGVWRGTRCREISTLPPEGMGIWKWGSTWITTVSLTAFIPYSIKPLIMPPLYPMTPLTVVTSLQLLPHHQRTLLRPPLPLPSQPPRSHHQHHSNQLLQIPILHLHRPDHLLLQLPPRLHKPIRRHIPIHLRVRAQRARHFLQIRHRADTFDR